jgi:hypothetical protein
VPPGLLGGKLPQLDQLIFRFLPLVLCTDTRIDADVHSSPSLLFVFARTHIVHSAFRLPGNAHSEDVGDAAHGNKDMDDLILHLLREPGLPTKVKDIVVECGNSLYQGVLDRYIAGDDVSLAEVRQVWRDTTATMCSVSGFYETLFPLVRRINQKLASGKKLRVLAGDPPVDWSKVKDQSQVMLGRDANAASVMKKEVLSKHRKALMLFGTGHLFHSNKTAPRGLESVVERYEANYPGVTFVIGTAIVSRDAITPPIINEMKEGMASWPVPSLVKNLKGTWLADVDQYYFSEIVDAISILAPLT